MIFEDLPFTNKLDLTDCNTVLVSQLLLNLLDFDCFGEAQVEVGSSVGGLED